MLRITETWAGSAHPAPADEPIIDRLCRAVIGSVRCFAQRLSRLARACAECPVAQRERIARKTYRTRNQARQDVFGYIERFYNPTRRHSTLGYLSPMDFEMQANTA